MNHTASSHAGHVPWWQQTVRFAGFPIVIIVIAVVLRMWAAELLGDYYAILLLDVGINVILAVSLTMVNGFTGQFSIGHAGFMAVGGYTAAAVVYYGSLRIWGNADPHGGALSALEAISHYTGPLFRAGDLLFVVALLVGGLVAAFLGFLVGLPSLRLRGDYLAIVTLGFGEIVRILLEKSQPVITDPAMVRATPPYELATHLGGALGFSELPTYTTLFWVYLFAGITVMAALRLKRSTYGRAFLAIRENEIAAETMGVPTVRYKVYAFVIAAFFAGIAGGLFAHRITGIIKAGNLDFQKSIEILMMVVLGGMGSISGAVIAAIILTVLPEELRAFRDYRMILYALTLILVMILRPQGLFGTREIWDYGLRWRRGSNRPKPPPAPTVSP